MKSIPFKLVVSALASFVLGVTAGFMVEMELQSRAAGTASSMTAGKILVFEANALERALASSDQEAKKRQLEHFADSLSSLSDELAVLLGRQLVSQDLAIAYGRLAMIYTQEGDLSRRREYLRRASEAYSAAQGRPVRDEEIMELVTKIDMGRAQKSDQR